MVRFIACIPTFLIPLLTILLGFVIGVILFYVVTFIERRGSWEQLESPPGDILRIVAAEQYSAIVETGDNLLYEVYCRVENADDVCWEEVEDPIDVPNWSCDDDVFPQPPDQVRDQATFCFQHEYLVFTRYFLLKDGSLWRWEYAVYPLGQVVQLVRIVIVSTIAGAIVGVVLVVSKKTQP